MMHAIKRGKLSVCCLIQSLHLNCCAHLPHLLCCHGEFYRIADRGFSVFVSELIPYVWRWRLHCLRDAGYILIMSADILMHITSFWIYCYC